VRFGHQRRPDMPQHQSAPVVRYPIVESLQNSDTRENFGRHPNERSSDIQDIQHVESDRRVTLSIFLYGDHLYLTPLRKGSLGRSEFRRGHHRRPAYTLTERFVDH
jgi:hypothetical protein